MVLAVDFGLALIVLLSLVAGAKNGFMESLFSIVSWFAGAIAALHLTRPLLAHLPKAVQHFPGISILLGVLLFLIVFFLIRMIGVAVAGNGKAPAEALNRLLGVIIGAIRGVLLAAIIASLLVAYLPPKGSVIRTSRAFPLLLPAGRAIAAISPPGIGARMSEGWDRVGRREAVEVPGPVRV